MKPLYRQLIWPLFALIVVAALSISAQQHTFSVEGLRLGMTRLETMEHWQTTPAARSDGDILVLERDDHTSVMVYFQNSRLGSIVSESLVRDGSSVKRGDTQASVRRFLGPPTETFNEPPIRGRRESRDVYVDKSPDGKKIVAKVLYSQERVVSCFLTYADCETVLDPF